MKKRIIGFIGSIVIDTNFVVGIIAGILLSVILVISNEWSIYYFLMFIVWALMLLLLDPLVNLGFILSFCPIAIIFKSNERIEIALAFFTFILINYFIYRKKEKKKK